MEGVVIMEKKKQFATRVQSQMAPIAAWCFSILLTHKWGYQSEQHRCKHEGVSVVAGFKYVYFSFSYLVS